MTTELTCPHCRQSFPAPPPEPPIGTWVKDRFGTPHHRNVMGWGQPGTWYLGKWEAMWQARGPLVECAPWGNE